MRPRPSDLPCVQIRKSDDLRNACAQSRVLQVLCTKCPPLWAERSRSAAPGFDRIPKEVLHHADLTSFHQLLPPSAFHSQGRPLPSFFLSLIEIGGKLSFRPCIDAGCIKYSPLVHGGLRCRVPAHPDCTTLRIGFVSLAPHVRSTLPSAPLVGRPGASLVLRLHCAVRAQRHGRGLMERPG
jgi:hypothetical protein